jgi:hypothetical protein
MTRDLHQAGSLETKIARLRDLDLSDLQARWRAITGKRHRYSVKIPCSGFFFSLTSDWTVPPNRALLEESQARAEPGVFPSPAGAAPLAGSCQ